MRTVPSPRVDLGLRALLSLAFVALTLAIVQVASIAAPPRADADPAGTACSPVTLPNGSFESPVKTSTAFYQYFTEGTAGLQWQTTAADNQIEYWYNGSAATQANNNVAIGAQSGTQWAEVNASQASYLYQDVATVGGQILRWGVWHRGRAVAGSSGTDSMQVLMGSTGTQTPQVPAGQTSATITDGPNGWVFYSGTYTVPAAQTTTRFGFQATATSSGNASVGNFVDNVSLTSEPCVTTTKTVTNVNTSRANGTYVAGDQVQYTLTTTNPGGPATGTVLTDTLPAGLTYTPGTLRVDGAAVTDAAGDDLGSFAGGTVTVRQGTGATPTAGGTFTNGTTSTVVFRATVGAGVASGTTVTNSANTSFTWAPSTVPLTGTAGTRSFTTTNLAQAPLSCSNIYAIQGAAPRNVWQVNPTNGLLTSSGSSFGSLAGVDDATTINALGITDGGDKIYGVVNSAADATVKYIYEINRAAGTQSRVGQITIPATQLTNVLQGAVNPRTGIYYFGGIVGTTINLYGFDTTSGTVLGRVASGTVAVAPTVNGNAGNNGDLAFDNQNNLYVLAAGTTQAIIQSINEQLPTTAQATPATLTAKPITTITDNNSTTILSVGLAAGGQGDRRLYVAGGNNIRTVNPSTGAVEAIQTDNGAGTGGVNDLASCSSPNTIEAQASFPNGRTAGTDQATVTITGGGIASGNTGTTAGTDTGVQNLPAETAGPVFGLDNVAFTATQTGITTADYATTYSCTNLNTGTVLASGTGRTVTFTMPGNAGPDGTAAYCLFTNTRLVPAITLDKQSGTPSGLTPGSTVPYTFTIKNTGNVALSSVSVSDTKVGAVSCPTGTLAVGATRVCTTTNPYVLTSADVDAGQVVNTATATGVSAVTGLTAPNPTATDTDTLVIARQPALTLTKTATPAPGTDGRLNTGDTISYSFTVKNTGNTTLSNVAVTDPKVAGVTCSPVTLAAGASATCTTAATYVVKQSDVDAGSVVNTATATASPAGGGAALTTTATRTTSTSPLSSLIASFNPAPVVNKGPDNVLGVGDIINYTYTVTNNGDITVNNVGSGDTIPGTPVCAASAASLAPGASTTCTVTYTVTQADVDKGSVDDTVTPSGTPATGGTLGSANPASSSIPTTASASVVQVNLTPVPAPGGDGRLNAGDTVGYTVSVTNTGTTTLTNPVVTLPGFTVVCPTAALAPSATVTCTVSGSYTVTQADVDAGNVVRTASVTATGPGTDRPTDTDTATTPTSKTSSLVATFAPAPVLNPGADGVLGVGDTIAYTYTVTNNGDVTVNGVNVTDTIPGTPVCAASAASLAPKASTTCTLTYTVTQADVDAGAVNDTITPTGNPATGGALGTATPASSSVSTTATSSQVAVTLTAIPAPGTDGRLNAGDTVGYTVSVKNTGTTTLTAPIVSLPGFTVSCPAGALAPGASVSCTVTGSYTVTQSDVDAGNVVRTATVSATGPAGAKPTNASTATTPTSKTSSLVVTFAPAPVTNPGPDGVLGVGDTISYTYTVRNNGDVTVTGVGVNDSIPGNPVCVASAASLAPAATTTCTATYTVTQADVDKGSIDNVAIPTGTPATGGALGAAIQATSSIPTTASASVVQVNLTPVPVRGTDGRLNAGDTVGYTVSVTNTGTTTLTDPVVSLPGFTVVCPTGQLAPGATVTCTVSGTQTVTQTDVDAGAVVKTASVTATGPGTDRPTDTDTATQPTSRLSSLVATFAPAPVTNPGADGVLGVGDTVSYTYTVRNNGDVTVSTIGADDTIPGTPACMAATLAPNATTTCTATYTVTQADVDKGSVDDVVTPTGTPVIGGALGSATSATSSISTTATASLVAVTLTAVPAPGADGRLNAGDTVGYTVTVKNTGTTTLTDPVVSLPGFTVTCPTGQLAPNATVTCTVTGSVLVSQADVDSGSIVRTATVTANGPAGAKPTNTSTATTPTSKASGLVATFNPAPVSNPGADGILGVGDTITYTYTVRNNGDVTVNNVAAADTIPGTPTCAGTLAPNATTTCTVTYTVTQADVDKGSVDNTVTPSGTPATGGPLGAAIPASSSIPTTATASTVRVDLTPVPNPGTDNRLNAGDTVGYTVSVTNTGTTTLTNPVVTLPGFTVACPSGPLAPNGTVTCTVTGTYTLTQADVDAGNVVRTASVTATGPGTDRPTDTDTATTPTSTVSSLIATFAPAPVLNPGADGVLGVGDTIDYTYTVTNDGDVTVNAVNGTDTIPGTPVCAASAASLAPKASTTCTVTYTVTQADVDAGAVNDTVTPTGTPVIGGTLGTATPASSSISTTATASRVAVTLTPVPAPGADGRLNAGDTVGYAVTVTNTGTTTLTAPVVSVPGLSISCPAGTLAPGASVTCTVTGSATVTQADVDAGNVVRTATVVANGPAGAKPTNTSTATTPTSTTSSLVVTFNPAPVGNPGADGILGVGDTITYTYTVTNNGDVTVNTVRVDDSIPGTPTCAASAATLAPRATTTCTAVYTVTQADVDRGSVINTATPTGTPTVGGPLGTATPATSSVPTTASASVVQVNLTPVPAPGGDGRLNAGDTVGYTVSVTNTGTTTLTNPVVTLPGFTVSCSPAPLAPNATVTCTVSGSYTVTQADVDAGNVVRTASVTATGPGTDRPTDTDTATTPTSKTSSLVVTFDPAPVSNTGTDGVLGVGENITYTYTVRNTGDVTVKNVTVADSFPGSPTCAASADSLAPNATTTCTFVYTVTQADVDKGSVDDLATPTGDPAPGGPLGSATSASSSIPTTASASRVAVTLTAVPAPGADGQLNAGDTVGYTVSVTNTGTTTLTGVAVALPGFTVVCPATALAPGAVVTCTVTGSYTVAQPDVDSGSIVRTATVTATGPAGAKPAGTSTATTPTSKVSSLVVAITPPPVTDAGPDGVLGVGDTITYTYTVTNNGDVTVNNVAVGDTIPGTPVCGASAAALAPGATTTCTATYTITQADVDKGSVTNVATPSGAPATGGPLGAASPATSSIPVTGSASAVRVDLAAVPNPGADTRLNAGDTLTYTVSVTNTGTTTLNDPVVTLPGFTVSCPTGALAPNATVTCTVTGSYTVTQGDVDSGNVVLTATVNATGPGTANPSDTDTATTPTSRLSSLVATIAPTTDPGADGKLGAGDTITYTYTVRNNGDVSVDTVAVADTIPGSPTCSGSLAPTATLTCVVVYTITQADVDRGTVDDTVTPSGNPVTGGALGTATSATSSIPTTASASTVSVTLTAVPAPGVDGRLNTGDTVGYTVSVKNTGTTTLNDPLVTLPGFTVSCPTGQLLPGASVVCTVTGSYSVTQADVDAGNVVNTATVSATGPGGAMPGNTSTATTLTSTTSSLVATFAPDPVTNLGGDGVLGAGDTITYTYTVLNNGDVTVTNVAASGTIAGPPVCAASAASLAPGASTTCTVTYTITQADVDRGSVDNTVTPTGTPTVGGALGTATTATSSIPTTASASMVRVDLTPVPAPGTDGRLNAGDTVTYTVSVTNTGTTTLTSPVVTLPGFTVSCPAAALAPNATVTCTVTGSLTVTQADVDAGTITRTASVVANGPGGARPTDDDVASTPTSNVSSLAVSFAPAPVVDTGADNVLGVGDTITYTYTVTNNGDLTVNGVTVGDTVPGTPVCAASAASLTPGASTTCTATYTVTQADVDKGSVDNTGTPAGTPVRGGALGTATPATSSIQTTASAATVSVTLTAVPNTGADNRLNTGDTLTYTVSVTNTGTTTLTDPTVTLPGFVVSCPAGNLGAGLTTTCTVSGTYTLTQADVDAGRVVRTATVTATGPGGVTPTDDDVATVLTSATSGLVVTFDPAPVTDPGADNVLGLGDTITYTYLVTNNGDVTVNGVGVDDAFPGAPTCVASSLAAGASTTCTVTYTITQADVDQGSVSDMATPTGTPATGGQLGTATPASSSIPVSGSASTVRVDLTATPVPGADNRLNAGDTITYTVTVTNTGTTNLTDPVVTVPGLTIACPSGQLAPNATVTCTVTGSVTVTQTDVDAGKVIRTASVIASGPAGAMPTDTDTETTPTSATSALAVAFTPAPVTNPGPDGVLGVGDTIIYTYTVTNNGDVSVNGVSVSDSFPGTPTCMASSLAPGATTTCTVTYTVTQADVNQGAVTNVATPTGTPATGGALGTAAPATSTIPTTASASTIQVDLTATPNPGADGRLNAGDTVSYTVTVTNTGTTALSDPVVTVPGLSVVCPSGSLAPNATVTCTVTGTVTLTQADVDNGALVRTATVVANGSGGSRPTDTDTETTITSRTSGLVATLNPAPVVNTGPDGILGVGDTITYTYTVTNNGDVSVNGVGVDDTIAGSPVCVASSLAPGATTTCTATYTVTQADVDQGAVNNTGTPTGTPATGGALGAATPVVSSIPISGSASSVQVDLTATPNPGADGRLNAGDTVSYTVTVTNTGTTTLTGPVVTVPGLSVVCPAGSLAPNATVTCTVSGTVTVTQTDVDAGSIVRTATVTASGPAGAMPTDTDTETTPTSNTLGLAVTLAPPTTAPGADGVLGVGDTITYTYTVTNTGDVTVNGVGVDDTIAGTPTCTATSLAPGASTTCTVTYTVTQADVDQGSVTSTATPTGTPATGGQLGSATPVSSSIPVASTGSVRIVLSVASQNDVDNSGTTNAGDTISYLYTVTNNGTTTLTNVAVTDTHGATVTCPAGPLAPGATIVCTVATPYTITPADVNNGAVLDTATVNASSGSTPVTSASTVSTPTGSTPSVVIDLVGAYADTNGNGLADAGDTITYTYVVTNNGAVTLTSPTVMDTHGATVTCPAGSLAPGASITCTASAPYVITQTDADNGSVLDTATVNATGPGGAAVTDTDDETTPTSVRAPGLSIDKSADAPVDVNANGVSDAGDTIRYTFKVTNTGGTSLTGVTVNDPKFSSVTCPVTVLAPGSSMTCSAVYTITAADQALGTVDNTATASGTAPGQVVLTSAPDTTTTAVVGGTTGIRMDKRIAAVFDVNSNSRTDAGDQVIWEFVVTNTGTVKLTQVQVSDPLLANAGVAVTCPSTTLEVGATITCRSDRGTISAQAEADGKIVNEATATGTNPSGLVTAAQDSVTLTVDGAPGNGTTPNGTKPAGTKPAGDRPTGVSDNGNDGGGITVDNGDNGGTTLPNTGSEVRPWMPIGGVLLVLAGLFLVIRRRRETDEVTEQ